MVDCADVWDSPVGTGLGKCGPSHNLMTLRATVLHSQPIGNKGYLWGSAEKILIG
jgi:hypothetical protein